MKRVLGNPEEIAKYKMNAEKTLQASNDKNSEYKNSRKEKSRNEMNTSSRPSTE